MRFCHARKKHIEYLIYIQKWTHRVVTIYWWRWRPHWLLPQSLSHNNYYNVIVTFKPQNLAKLTCLNYTSDKLLCFHVLRQVYLTIGHHIVFNAGTYIVHIKKNATLLWICTVVNKYRYTQLWNTTICRQHFSLLNLMPINYRKLVGLNL